MRKHHPRKTPKMCARQHCGRMFRPWRKEQVCCSRSCARRHNPKFLAHIKALHKKAAAASARAKHAQANQRWAERAKDMTPAQIAKVNYRRGYCAGMAKKGRADYARGYQQALDDMAAAEKDGYARGYRDGTTDTVAGALA